ncbi:MAG: DUF4091 domain-containing protein [Oscillospiraceae bacterium]|nr:DUF4091 domain-containing protein [Oscillospiraceae bacterium]
MITTKIFSSLSLIKPESCPENELKEFSLLKNEPFSFQMAFKITDGSLRAVRCFVKATSDIPVKVYYANCVPVIHTDYSTLDPNPIGLYPDILVPKKSDAAWAELEAYRGIKKYFEKGETTLMSAFNDCWQTLWVCVNEDGKEIEAGEHTVTLELFDQALNKLGENSITLSVIDRCLPEQSLIYTNWFHYDCLSDFYNKEIFSDEFFEVMRDFVRKAASNGMNMLLTPFFTPPLDTMVGDERKTAQLVKIKLENGKYSFDFSLLKRFMDMCREDGIRYFEHSHLFTQWGAKHAPKIVAEVDGEEKRIFGWDTDAVGDEYVYFLRSYLTELRKFLKAEGLEKNILFHISDEPNESHYMNYQAAYDKIADLLDGFMVGDALSHVEFFESGLVKIPIALTRFAHKFVGKGDNIWAYYTGEEVNRGLSNRLIQMPRERNRILGVELYHHNIKGFLHWAYNFYYGESSKGLFNPCTNTTPSFPNAGTSYMVYPAHNGTAYQSIRQKNFAEGLIDMRALQLLESLSGREVCDKLIEEYFGEVTFFTAPDAETLLNFRKAVNEKIKNAERKL